MATQDSSVAQEQGFLSHLIELRNRLMKMMLSVLVLFACLFPFMNDVYTALAAPLLRYLPGSQMIAIDVASPFLIPFKLTLMVCVFLAVPFLLYQIWAFVAPGLYSHEKKLVVPLLVSSTLLFYAGVAFAYFAVFPLVFSFFTSVAPDGVQVSTDIGSYLDFVITLFFAFGIAFEVPVATVLVVAVGFTTPEKLIKARPYIFVGAFVVGMFLTPPDVISQVLLAVPMWLLFEVGVVFSKVYKKRIVAAGEARERIYESNDTPDEVDTHKLESSSDEGASGNTSKNLPSGNVPGSYRNSLTDSDDGSESGGDEHGP